VEALLDLYRDGNFRPSTTEIAEHAGLSPRSLFRYFDDVDDLSRAAVRRQRERAMPLLEIAVEPAASLEARARALAEQRIRLFSAVEPAATVSRLQSPFHPLLHRELTRGRGFLRSQIRELFRPELDELDAREAELVLAAVDVLCSFESYSLLSHDQRLGPARAKAAMTGSMLSLFGRGVPRVEVADAAEPE
jgi:AcrR family transcriptional regulator